LRRMRQSPGFASSLVLGHSDVAPLSILLPGYLHTLGTAADLRAIHMAGLAGRFGSHEGGQARVAPGTTQGSWLGRGVRVGPGASVIDSVLEPGVIVEPHAVVVRSVVLRGTRVGADERLRDEVAYRGVRVGVEGLRPAPTAVARHLRRWRLDASAVFGWFV